MPINACLARMRLVLFASIMAGLTTGVHAQTVATPNFTVARQPELVLNVWPADFNRDGRTDLVAGTQPPLLYFLRPLEAELVISFGRGDGTFFEPRKIGIAGVPLTVSDLNADGFTDIVFRSGDSLKILPGRGDGTFAAARTVAPTTAPVDEVRVWAYVVDLDGDGHRDIIIPEFVDTLKFYRGNGDLTFKPAIDLMTRGGGYQPAEATSGDLNGDGRRDLVVVSPNEVDIFLNVNGVTFTRSNVGIWPLSDVTLRDMNTDGKLDLVVASGRFEVDISQDPGQVFIHLGKGDGTFQPGVGYDTGVIGTMSIVTGDFNADGKADVATGNRSTIRDSDLGVMLFDSITVFPGDGTGRLLTPVSFALGSVASEYGLPDQEERYQGLQHRLNTSDLNADGRVDLISSPGAILLNRPAAANRPPVAFAGADRTEFSYDMHLALRGQGTDPDNHWLTYRWTDATGAQLSTLPTAFVQQEPGTSATYVLTVSDSLGGVSTDSITVYVRAQEDPYLGIYVPNPSEPVVRGMPQTIAWDVYDPESEITSMSVEYSLDDGRTFQPVPGCGGLAPRPGQCVWQNPGPLTNVLRLRLTALGGPPMVAITPRIALLAMPGGFSSADIGAVGAAGTTAFAGGTWTIEGSGADIWGTADEFRFVNRMVYGDFTAVVRVASIENLDPWTKAGLMIREGLTAGARHVSLLATPRTERGIAFQRRRAANGLSVHTAGPAAAPPGWLALGRVGDTISAYYRPTATAPWTLVGRDSLPGLPPGVNLGFAVTSHVDGQLATAVFDSFSIEPVLLDRSADVGAVGVAGSSSYDGVQWEVNGSGADIWGTADAFRMVHSASGLAYVREISARVISIQNTNAWAKAGVMFRGTAQLAESAHVMVVVTPGKGVAMQYRPDYKAPSIQVAVRVGVAPEWVRLTQVDGVFRGYASEDGVTWQLIGTVTVPWQGEPVLAVTSHNNATTTRAVFQNLRLRNYISQ
jgi:hypothetical protein